MLKLARLGPHEWGFEYPDIYQELKKDFNLGCELFEAGKTDEADIIFKSVLAQMPDHLDAIHHAALVLSRRNLHKEAVNLWAQAVRIGRKAFPQVFKIDKDLLDWGYLHNRPFLRCLHGLALATYREGQVEEALSLFRELLSLNPGDNLGVRGMAATALLKIGRPEEALKLTEKYSGDTMPDCLYGQALALFKLGNRQKATAALNKAIKYSPRVAAELLKSRHRSPTQPKPDLIEKGGADEAYDYWERSGPLWKEDAAALEWLRGVAKRTPGDRREAGQ